APHKIPAIPAVPSHLPPVVDEKPYAPIWRRLLSWVIDNIIVNSTAMTLVLLARTIAVQIGQNALFESESNVLTVVALLAYYALYEIFFLVKWNGQTPGKWLLKIRAIRDDEKAIDAKTATIYSLSRNITVLSPVGPFVPAFTMLWPASYNKGRSNWN